MKENRARGGGSKSTQAALGQASRQGSTLWREIRDEAKPIDLEYVLRHGEGTKNCRSLERVAHDG